MSRRLAGAVPLLAGFAALLVSWLLLTHVGFWQHGQIVDVGLYRDYAANIVSGRVPYRDFSLVYPPGALVPFLAAEIGRPSEAAYLVRFEWLMALCAAGTLVAAEVVLRAADTGRRRRAVALVAAGVAPLALGSVVLSRYDLWPALLTAAGVAALVSRRNLAGGTILGVAVAAKVYPAAALPVLLAYVWRRDGRRAAARLLAASVGAFAAIVLPFVAIAPAGALHSFAIQVERPLEFESLGAALLLAAHHTVGLSLGVVWSYGSANLGGTSAALVADALSLVEVAALLWLWKTAAARVRTVEQLVTAVAASIAVLLAFGKVFSPQYLVWLLPFACLADERLRRRAILLLLGATVLTQTWYPRRFYPLTYMDARESWFLLARDLTVVALALVLLRGVSSPAGRSVGPTPAPDAAALGRPAPEIPT